MAFGKHRPVNWQTFGICVIISLGQFVAAYQTVIIGTTIGKKDFMHTVSLWNAKNKPTPNYKKLLGAIVGLFQAGAVFGCILGAYVTEKWGRKAGAFWSAIITIIGLAGLTASVNMPMFLVFRVITGLGTWAQATVSATYIAELAPYDYRGFFAGLNGVMIGAGVCFASYIGMGFFFSKNPVEQWRAPLGIPIFVPLLILACLPITPESPRFLLLQDRGEGAWKIFAKINSDDGEGSEGLTRTEFYQMKEQAVHDRSQDSSWKALLTTKPNLKRLYLGCMLTFFGQSTGVIVINNYGQTFYAALGFDAAQRQILQGNRDTIALIGNIIGSILIDRVGRKFILLFGFIGCLIVLIIETVMVALYAGTHNIPGQNTGVAFMYIFLVFYSLGIDVGIFTILGEIFPNHHRTKGVALSLAVLNATSTIYLSVTSIAFAALGWKFFLIFVCVTAVAVLWVFTIPETKNLPLEETAALFGDAHNVMVFLKDAQGDAIQVENIALEKTGKATLIEETK